MNPKHANLPDFTILAASLADSTTLTTDFTDREDYLHDATDIAGGAPLALLLVENENDVVACVNFCRDNSIPIVTRGAGTGLSGGCVPSDGCLILSTENMIDLTLDPAQKTAYAGPGVITKDLMDLAAEFSLTYPPDPASYEESTLGGNVAENAGGLRCKRFGVTRDYVIGLKAIDAEGRQLRTGIYADREGFNIENLLIGSEGTLTIITEIALRLIDSPETGDTILVAFDRPTDAAQTVTDITRSGIIPTVLEYLDGDAADCSNKYEQTEGLDNVAAILLIETSGGESGAQSDSIRVICERNHCSYIRIESDPERATQLWNVRRNLSHAVKEIAKIRISEDVAVPNSQFPALISYVASRNAVSPLRINSFGHAGDGNLHVNFLSNSEDSQTMDLIETEIENLLRKAVDLGGVLTGEHGIGLAKRDYLQLEFSDTMIAHQRHIKSIFDPADLLNPGKIFR